MPHTLINQAKKCKIFLVSFQNQWFTIMYKNLYNPKSKICLFLLLLFPSSVAIMHIKIQSEKKQKFKK